jgi:alkylation response protein AidB-like acyl-CoA dehydrogenase
LEFLKIARDLGFVGVFIDKKIGGLGYGFFEHCLINEEFMAVEPGIGSAILSTTFGAERLQLFGSEHQKETGSGELLVCD